MNRNAISILMLVAATAASMPLLAETRQRYTVTTTAAAPHSRAMRIVANAGAKVQEGDAKPVRLRTYSNVNGFAADLTAKEAAELRTTSGITSVDPVVSRHISDLSGEMDGSLPTRLESYDAQVTPWGLPVIRIKEVWPVTRGEGVNVVVLDTGIDLEHPDLKAAYAGGYNVYEPAGLPIDDNFHGTHVAGTIAATDNNFGVVGAAPNVKLWAVKGIDHTGNSFDEYIAAGIDWAVSKQRELGGRWVVNMSLGAAAEGGKLEKAAVERANDAGLILIASAGNRSAAYLEYPAHYPGVIAVGAIGQDGRRAEFSNYSNKMDIVGPGVDVQSTLLRNYQAQSDVVIGTDSFDALAALGSPKGRATGRIVDCKLGYPEEFPESVRGNIALIRRGTLTFREKARNAKDAGATAVIISEYPGEKLAIFTLIPQGCPSGPQCPAEWKDYAFPITMGVTAANGDKLRQAGTASAIASHLFAEYARLSGTSMAAPHVSSTAAILLSLNPALKSIEIAFILKQTARDTADEGWDYETGYGVIDALAAAKWVAPAKFNVPPPNYHPGRRRGVRP